MVDWGIRNYNHLGTHLRQKRHTSLLIRRIACGLLLLQINITLSARARVKDIVKMRKNCSWAWKGIAQGGLVVDNLGCRIGNGMKIDLVDDTWLNY